jgi:putative ABC transport system permease protein
MFRKFLRKTPLAWLQLKREPTRLAVAIAGIAFADVLIFFQVGLTEGLFDSVTKPYTALQGDLFLINPLFESLSVVRSFPRRQLYQAAGASGVRSINYLYIDQGRWRNPQTLKNQTTMVFAINPSNSAIVLPEVQSHLNQLSLLNQIMYDRTGPSALFGDILEPLNKTGTVPIQFNKVQTKVIGTFTMGASFTANGNIITSHSTFLQLFPERRSDEIDVGIITLQPGTNIERIQAEIRSQLKDVLVLTHAEFIDHEKKYWQVNSPIGFLFGFGAVIGFIVGAVIVYQILYSDVSDHLSEYATLKAMGYSDAYLMSVLIQESLIIAVLGFMPGFLVSLGLYAIVTHVTFIPILMNFNRAGLVLILTIVMCVGSGGIAMRKLQEADPADIF